MYKRLVLTVCTNRERKFFSSCMQSSTGLLFPCLSPKTNDFLRDGTSKIEGIFKNCLYNHKRCDNCGGITDCKIDYTNLLVMDLEDGYRDRIV